MKKEIKNVSVNRLKVHPLNKKLYGENENINDLMNVLTPENITPLVVNQNYTILAGHRRYMVAKIKKFKTVPVEIRKFNNQKEEIAFLISDNITKELNNYQKIKTAVEFKKLTIAGVTGVTLKKGERMDEIIARIFKLGGYRTFARANAVLNHIQTLQKQNKYAESKHLIELLNENVVAAEQLIKDNDKALTNLKVFTKEVEKEQKKKPNSKLILSHFTKRSLRITDLNQRQKLARNLENNNEFKLNKFWLGDSIEVLKNFKDKSIDCVITDPPYAINFEHSFHQNYKDSEEFVLNTIDKVCKELDRITKDNCHLYFCFSFQHYQKLYNLLSKYFKVSLIPLIWQKSTRTHSEKSQLDYYNAVDYECILFCQKGNRKLNYPYFSSILKAPSVIGSENRLHSGIKPIALLKELILRSSLENEVVLDPFAGSGSTCLASALCKRWFIGIEKDPIIWQRSYFNNWSGSIHTKFNQKTKTFDIQKSDFLKTYSVLKDLIQHMPSLNKHFMKDENIEYIDSINAEIEYKLSQRNLSESDLENYQTAIATKQRKIESKLQKEKDSYKIQEYKENIQNLNNITTMINSMIQNHKINKAG